jgi:DNA-binding SARP family transcriptional activator
VGGKRSVPADDGVLSTAVRANDQTSSLQLQLLGGFQLTSGGRAFPLPAGARRLLAFLAINDQPALRDFVSETLWVDSSEAHCRASLRSAVWRIRQSGLPLLEISVSHIGLHPELPVDHRWARQLVRTILADKVGISASDLDWRPLVKDVLPDSYEDWVVVEREQFRQLRLHALERLCEVFTQQHCFAQAVAVGLAAVSSEPLRESAQRALIHAHLDEGNFTEAISQYRSYCTILERELGLQPSSQMEELVSRLWPRRSASLGPNSEPAQEAGGSGRDSVGGRVDVPGVVQSSTPYAHV